MREGPSKTGRPAATPSLNIETVVKVRQSREGRPYVLLLGD